MKELYSRPPLVSIIMPTYNQGQFIEGAVESVLAQSFPDFELIIVSDGSTDSTNGKVIAKSDRRIRFFMLPHGNDHGVGALNFGLAKARGAYLTWVSSDNLYLSCFIRDLVQAIEVTGADFAWGDLLNIDEGGRLEEVIRPPHVNTPFDLAHMTTGYTFGIAFMWTRSCFEKVGPYRISPYADFDHAVRMMEAEAEIVHVPHPLAINRIHGGQVSMQPADLPEHRRIRDRAADLLCKQEGYRLPPLEERPTC